jgi:hypothetical protein
MRLDAVRVLSKYAIYVIIFAYCVVSPAANGEDKIAGDFEGTGMRGIFAYQSTPDGLSVEYYSPTGKGTQHYRVPNFDVCSSMALYRIPHSRQVAIDGSCSSRGGQIFRDVYAWNPTYEKWCLIREVTGEKPDVTAGTVAPVERVARVIGCSEIGASGPYSYEPAAAVQAAIKNELRQFADALRNPSELKTFIASMPDYSVAELSSYVDSTTVEAINNLAFYLTENGRSYVAIPLLISIVRKFPDRVVAKLNLADAYWDNDMKTQAAERYRGYVNEMRESGKSSRVPKRVLDRLDE